MAGRRDRVFHIVVLGVSGPTQVRGDLGVGKSCLCNRFVRPHKDEFYLEHINVISQSDFSGRIVNNDHFIYWGDAQKVMDGHETVFRIMEQTEFIDDSSFMPLRGSNTRPYIKRAAETKLSSSEKLMYICKDQVGDDLGYSQKLLPEGKFQVDGFIIVFDVSRVRNRTLESQMEFLSKLHQQVHKAKKPTIMVATKCDNSEEICLRECKQLANKLKLTLIETSATLGVNVDLPFLLLAAQIDKSRSKPKEISFNDANRKFTDQLRLATDQYLELLTQEVTDYHNVFLTKKKSFENGEIYRSYIRLAGTAEARKQFRNHTKRLKQKLQQRKMEQYFERLPGALQELLPDLKSINGRDWAACRDALKDHPAFPKWFVLLNESWEDSEYINTDEILIPYNLLTSRDSLANNIFMEHVNLLNAAKRKESMKKDFKHLLQKMSDVVLPGSNFHVVKVHLDQNECYKELQDSERVDIFLGHQEEIIKSALTGFLELLLEKSNLFMTFNREGNLEDHLSDLQDELNTDSRYQILSELESDRYVKLLKYLAFTHSPVRDSCFMQDQEACMDKIIQQTIELKVQKTPVKDALGKWSRVNGRLQLLILGEDGLAEELASEIKNLQIDDELAFDGDVYNMDIRTVDKDIIQGYNQFSADFSPQGCICVFTSLQSFQNVKSNLEKTGLMDNVDDDSKPLRNLPVTLMFGRDSSIPESDVLALQEEAQKLAKRINDCEIVNTEEGGGSVFLNKNFNDRQILKAFHFMIPLMNNRARCAVKDPEGTVLKLRVVMMCGDPFRPDFVLSPLIKENDCYRTPNVPEGISIEMFIDTDRRKVDVEVLSYHQALLKHKDFAHAYILAYSVKRKASLEVLKTFLKRLARVPIMMVAVGEETFSNQHNEYLVREGNKEADATPNARFLIAGSNFPAQTVAYSTFLKDAYNKRQETESIHNDLHFRKLPTPPHSPVTPIADFNSDDDNSDEEKKRATQSVRPPPPPRALPPQDATPSQDYTSSPGHSVLHDHLVKPSDIRKRQNSKEALYDEVHSSYSPSTNKSRVSTSSEDIPSPIYAQINKPRRFGSMNTSYPTRPPVDPWVLTSAMKDSAYSLVQKPHQPAVAPRRVNSFHSGRGFSNYDEPVHKTQEEEPTYEDIYPCDRQQRQNVGERPLTPLPSDTTTTEEFDGWEDNVAYGVAQPSRPYIPPPPSSEPPQPPGPYGVVSIYPPDATRQEAAEDGLYDLVGSTTSPAAQPPPSVYAKPQKMKPPVKPRPRRLDQSKFEHLAKTLNQGPSPRIVGPHPAKSLMSPVRDNGGGYAQPHDAVLGGSKLAIGSGVYAQPADALTGGQNQRVRMKSAEKSSPKSTPHDKPRSKKKQQDKKKKKSEDPEKDNTDKFLEELERLIGQAAPDDCPISKSNTVDPYPTLKDKKQQKKKVKKMKKTKIKPGKPKGHLRDLQIEDLKFNESGVPPFIEQCTHFIEREGITSEGIYRMPGKTQDIDEILTHFDQDPDFVLESMNYTINATASAIKQFFTRLPEPILPYDVQHELIERYSQIDTDTFCDELYSAIHSITPQRLSILKYMMLHLERIMQQSEQNKMTSDNISTCWWPSMLHPRSQSFDDLAIEAQLANIFRLLIERTDFFFGEAVQEEEMVEDGDTQALLSNQMEGMGEELR
ncbi:rho GTPase-activating protein 5-like isoform X4 [Apostichopus japonicus]|uniref:rho GTPase-activating protein 5-like isoform X4 n=1 Tax=Stichopus japonicus TaxID=307972 RepID=UPI003AB3A14A